MVSMDAGLATPKLNSDPAARPRLPTVRFPMPFTPGEIMPPLPTLTDPPAMPFPARVPVTLTAPAPVAEPEVLLKISVPAITATGPVKVAPEESCQMPAPDLVRETTPVPLSASGVVNELSAAEAPVRVKSTGAFAVVKTGAAVLLKAISPVPEASRVAPPPPKVMARSVIVAAPV